MACRQAHCDRARGRRVRFFVQQVLIGTGTALQTLRIQQLDCKLTRPFVVYVLCDVLKFCAYWHRFQIHRVILEVGDGVQTLKVGDRVSLESMSPCWKSRAAR